MYKTYEAIVRVNDNNETLSMCCKTKQEAKQLAIEVYDGYVRTRLINNYEILAVYLKSKERAF